MEMGRTVVYPAPRCNLTWLGGERNNHLPLEIPMQFKVRPLFALVDMRHASAETAIDELSLSCSTNASPTHPRGKASTTTAAC